MANLGMCKGQGSDYIEVLICGPKVGQSGSYSTCNMIYVTSRVIEIDYGMVETSWWGAGMSSFPQCTQLTIQSFPVIAWFSKKQVSEQLWRKPCDNWVGVWVVTSSGFYCNGLMINETKLKVKDHKHNLY